MNLNQMPTIKGLNQYQDIVLPLHDTDPRACRIWFTAESIFLPALSKSTGKRETKTFVYLNFEMELGRSSGRMRINDEVEFNPETKKWDIMQLSPNGDSHVMNYTNEWNAFYDNIDYEEIGTPLDLLFPYNPERVDIYHKYNIRTIERLAALSESDASSIGMGGMDDMKKAKKYVERMNASVTGVKFNAEMEAKDAEIKELKAQLNDISSKLGLFLDSQGGAPKLTPAEKRKQTNEAKKAAKLQEQLNG